MTVRKPHQKTREVFALKDDERFFLSCRKRFAKKLTSLESQVNSPAFSAFVQSQIKAVLFPNRYQNTPKFISYKFVTFNKLYAKYLIFWD